MSRTNSYYGSPKHIAHCVAMGQAKRIVRDLDWFMRWVNKDGPVPPRFPELGPCWLWMGTLEIGGYGFISWQTYGPVNSKKTVNWKAHRYGWMLYHGEIPHGLWVLHHCDNPPCVNPKHLFLGDNEDNQRDSHNKDRGHYKAGERHPRATISNETARRIKEMIRDGMRVIDISRELDVKVYVVENIKYGQSFKWLTL